MISIENRARLLFVLVLLVAAMVGAAWYFHVTAQYKTYQLLTGDSVSGLLTDAPVEFHGVDVGKVSAITLIDPHSVSILLNIKKEVVITTTTVATITSRGLATRGFTGYVYVSLDDPGLGAQQLTAEEGQAYPRIKIAPARSLNLDTAISQLNQNVQFMTDVMRSIFDRDTVASLKQTADNLQKVTHTLAENNRKLASIISNTQQASSQFSPLLESGNAAVNTLQEQILPETYRTLDQMNRLSDTLRGVVNRIDQNPAVLLRGSTSRPPGPGESP